MWEETERSVQRRDSLNVPSDGEVDPDKPQTLADKLAEERPVLTLDLSSLSETDRQIIEARIAGYSLSEIGKAHGRSAERIRQREARARDQITGSVASECISDLVNRGKVVRVPGRAYARTEPGFRDRSPPKHAYREPQPSNEIQRHRANATPLCVEMAPFETRRDPMTDRLFMIGGANEAAFL